ncbi:hypothetical protein Tco_1040911 [Tanacetum coccineum]|uniref:Uncharacterized protein n=1 Tax=Tanacetum coccineum TaxID=301880 RepID=A0ABQ5GG59_9ASTR
MLKIFPKLLGQEFKEPLLEEEILSFIRDLGHTGEIKFLSDVNVNHMHQPWRSFAAIINQCLSGKTTALESLCLSRAQIIWGMYHNKNVDYVYLLWEDLVYQVENKNSKKNNDMYYPRFTKVIVDYFMAKDQAIPRRNKMRSLLKLLKEKRIKTSAKGDKAAKIKQSATKSKGLAVLSKVALSEADQMKLATKRSKKEFYSSHVSGSGAGNKPEVPDVPEYRSKSKEESWIFSQGEDEEENDKYNSANDNDNEDDDQENDSGETESDDDGDNFVHPNLSTYKADDQEKEKEEEKANDDDEVSSDQMVSTPPDYEISDEEENQEDDDNVMGGEQEDEEDEELYGDLNLNLDRRDAEMTNAQTNQETEEVHVTLTTEPLVVQQQSSSISSDLVSKFINPSSDTRIDSILNPNIQSDIPVNVSVSATTKTSSRIHSIRRRNPQPSHLYFGFEEGRRIMLSVRGRQLSASSRDRTNAEYFAKLIIYSGIVENLPCVQMEDAVKWLFRLKGHSFREKLKRE